MLRSLRPLLLAGFVGCVSLATAGAQTAGPSKSDNVQNRVERLLQATAAGKKLEGDPSDLIPSLIAIVENGEIQESELSMHALAMRTKKSMMIDGGPV